MNSRYHTWRRTWRAAALRMIGGVAVAAAVTALQPAAAQVCISSVSQPMRIDGVLALETTPVGCMADTLLWGFAQSQSFTPSAAQPSQTAKLFLRGFQNVGGGSVDTLYVGVQFKGDAQLDDKDKLLLVFDANGNGGAFDAPDFAILAQLAANPPASGEQCNQNLSSVTFYKGASMTQQALPPETSIKVRRASDYDAAGDPENEIWEIEYRLNPTALGLSMSGTTFRMGARMLVGPAGLANPTIWRWPAAIDADPNFLHVEPASISGLTAGTLSTTAFGSCCSCGGSAPMSFMGIAPMLMLAGGSGLLYRRARRKRNAA